jgi:hypothetical protein
MFHVKLEADSLGREKNRFYFKIVTELFDEIIAL